MKIDPELKFKWTSALRSGEYKQGKGYLEDDGKFCCLGVLCKVAGLPTKKEDEEFGNTPIEWIPKNDVLPSFLCDCTETTETLSQMNDGYRDGLTYREAPKTFNQIADYIDANL